MDRSVTRPPRISEGELDKRLAANAPLLRVAAMHIEWLSRSMGAVRHVAYLTDADGILLHATGNAPDMIEQLGLRPGSDWCEQRIGTNGAGMALVTGEPAAVIGAEHFVQAFARFICTAAPIRDADGRVIGSLAVSTGVDDAASERLLLAEHVAYVIEQQLRVGSRTAHEPQAAGDLAPIAATVLNVDDQDIPRYVRTKVLKGAGCRVIEASNAADALRLARAEHPDVAIVDVQLQQQDEGLELARAIKADPCTSDIAVISVSAAYVQPEDRARALESGANVYLAEPVEPRELALTVRTLLHAAEARRRRIEAQRKLEAQYAIAKALADSDTLAEAAPRVLAALCEAATWDTAELWTPDAAAGVMRRVASSSRGAAASHFAQESEAFTFARGEGLVGAAWASERPIWVSDVASDARVARRALAVEQGLRTAYATPVLIDGDVVAVLASFNERARPADEELVRLVAFVSRLLAQFIARLRTLDALREQEAATSKRLAELAGIYDAAPVGLCVLDRELRYRQINRRLAELNGKSIKEHIGRTVREVIPAVADIAEPMLRHVLETGEPLFDTPISAETSASPGELRHFVEQWLPIRDASGEVVGINIVAEEITERLRAEQALRASEEKFHFALRHTSVSVTESDRDLRYTWAYNSPPRFPADRVIGYRDDEIVSPEMARPMIEAKARVLATGAGERFDYEVEMGDEIRTYDVTLEARRDETGTIQGVAAAFFDVTDRRRAAQEMQRLLNVAQQAHAEAEAASREKDNFLAVLSHELRTPLNSLSMAVAMLADEAQSSRGERVSALARKELAHMARLVDDLLEASRVSRGKIPLDIAPVDLRELLHETLHVARHTAEDAGIDLVFEPADTPLLVSGDAVRLKQVFSNLISNALKYSSKGKGVRVSATRAGAEVEVRVLDEGVGIPPEVLPRIFGLFVQAKEGARGGLGIGLAIVRGLVDLHGGSITATSEGAGRGSEFVVRLPAL